MVNSEIKNTERSTILTIVGTLFCLVAIILIYPFFPMFFGPFQTNGHTPDIRFIYAIPLGVLLGLLSTFITPLTFLLKLPSWTRIISFLLYSLLILIPFFSSNYYPLLKNISLFLCGSVILGMFFIPKNPASITAISLGGIGILVGIWMNVS